MKSKWKRRDICIAYYHLVYGLGATENTFSIVKRAQLERLKISLNYSELKLYNLNENTKLIYIELLKKQNKNLKRVVNLTEEFV